MPGNKPNGRGNQAKGGTTSSSSHEPSDEDDEASPCEQSTNPIEMKRLRRYLKQDLKLNTEYKLIYGLQFYMVMVSGRFLIASLQRGPEKGNELI